MYEKQKSIKSKRFNYLKSICLSGCLLCIAAEATANLTENYSAQVYLTVKMNNKTVRDVFSYIEKTVNSFLSTKVLKSTWIEKYP